MHHAALVDADVALAIIRDCLMFVDRHDFLFANKAFEELCDATSHEIRQSALLVIMTPMERTSFFDHVRGLMDCNKDVRTEALVECIGTQTGAFLSKVSFHVYRDDADSKHMRCACKFSDPLFYHKLFSVAAVPIAIVEYLDKEEDCRVVRCNRSAVESLGSPEALTIDGLSVRRDLGVHFKPDTYSFFRACRQGVPHLKSLICKSRLSGDDIVQPVLLVAFAFIGFNVRSIPVFTLVANDFTAGPLELTQLETCEKLVVSQSLFFAKVMHELRAPVSGLMGMASLLRQTALTFEQKDFVKTIEICGDTLFSYTGTILDLTNIEHNNLVLSLASFSLEQCIEEALSMVSPAACVKKIELLYEIESPNPSPLLIGDMLRVRQVLLALLSNAVKFTTKEKAHVTVQAVVKEEPSGLASVSFAAKDEGIGISPSQQLLLFKAVTQADRSVGEIFGGTGLGLAISKSLVELMGGSLVLHSEQGRGSIFQFTLPVELPVADCNTQLMTMNDSIKGRPILLVLADAVVVANLLNRLSAFQLKPFCWSPDQPSVEEATNNVVLTDQETLARRRAELSLPTILLGWARPLNYNGNFLRKPICTGQLHKAVENAFGLSQSSLEVESEGAPTTMALKGAEWRATCRVLIVNDDVIQRKVLNRMLEALNFARANIRTANDGQEALVRLEQQMADLILMDWHAGNGWRAGHHGNS